MTEDKFQGTGDEIGRIELGDGYELVVRDDGDLDTYTNYRIYDADGIELMNWRQLREEVGDAKLAEMLGNANGKSTAATPSPSSFDRAPPAYSCNTCHNSWPRGTNQTPDAPEDTCPDCYDG